MTNQPKSCSGTGQFHPHSRDTDCFGEGCGPCPGCDNCQPKCVICNLKGATYLDNQGQYWHVACRPAQEKERKCSVQNPCNDHLAGTRNGCTPVGNAFAQPTKDTCECGNWEKCAECFDQLARKMANIRLAPYGLSVPLPSDKGEWEEKLSEQFGLLFKQTTFPRTEDASQNKELVAFIRSVAAKSESEGYERGKEAQGWDVPPKASQFAEHHFKRGHQSGLVEGARKVVEAVARVLPYARADVPESVPSPMPNVQVDGKGCWILGRNQGQKDALAAAQSQHSQEISALREAIERTPNPRKEQTYWTHQQHGTFRAAFKDSKEKMLAAFDKVRAEQRKDKETK